MEEASSPVKAKVKPRPPTQHPKTIDMVVDAVSQSKSIKGVTIAAIKNFIVEKYPTANTGMLRNLIKKAILKGLDQGILVRPESSGAEMGMKGRFRVDRRRLAEINKPTKKPKAKAKPVEKSPKPVKKKATKSEKSPSNKSLKSPKSADKKPVKPKKLADKAEAKKKVGKNVIKPKETTKAKKSPKEKKPTKTKSQTKPDKSPKPKTKKTTATKKITKKAGKSE